MNTINDYLSKFEQIAVECKKGGLNTSQIGLALIAFAFIHRIDCLIKDKAQECETYYENNKNKLSDERLDQGLRDIMEGLPFYNVSGYSLKSIYHNQKSIDYSIRDYMEGFSSNVKSILKGIRFDKIVTQLSFPSKCFVEVISILTSIEMSDNYCFREQDFEELIVRLKTKFLSSKVNGTIPTPEPLSALMAECLCVDDYSIMDSVSIFDPVCGTGGLLLAAQKRVRDHFYAQSVDLFGQDIDPTMTATTNAMLLLLGSEKSLAKCGNTLLEDCFRSQTFDFIVASLPFSLSWKGVAELIRKEEGFGRYSYGLPNTNDAQFLFIQHMISKMNPSGARIATLSTGSVLWSADGSIIRRRLFEKDLVEAIIALPQGVLPYTSIPTFLWIFNNKKNNKRQNKVQLIDGRSFSNRNNRECSLNEDSVRRIMVEYTNYSESANCHILSKESFLYYTLKLSPSDTGRPEYVQIPATMPIEEYLQKENYSYGSNKVGIDYSSVEKGCAIQFDRYFEKEIKALSLHDSADTLILIAEQIASFNLKVKEIGNMEGYDNYQNSNSIFSSVPSRWKEYPLRAISDIIKGQAKPIQEDENGLPYIMLGTLLGNDERTLKYKPSLNSKLMSSNDVAIVCNGSNAGEVYLGVDGILSSWLVMLRPNDNILPKFLYYLLKGHEQLFITMKTGVVNPHLALDALRSVKVYIPSYEEQMQIVSFLDDVVGHIDRITALLGNGNNAYTTYRQALIQNVVFGAIKIYK